MEPEWIDKLDVARRQIVEAVRLFFARRDNVAIHTMIAAGHQILVDVGKVKGVEGALKNTKVLRDPKNQDYLKAINYPFNFFKHADRDGDDKINVAPLQLFTKDFIMDGIVMLQRITGDLPIEAKIYWFWFVSKHPEDFANLPEESVIAELQKAELGQWDFGKLYQLIQYADLGNDAHNALEYLIKQRSEAG